MSNSNDKSNISISYNNVAYERNEYKIDTWEVNEIMKFMKILMIKENWFTCNL